MQSAPNVCFAKRQTITSYYILLAITSQNIIYLNILAKTVWCPFNNLPSGKRRNYILAPLPPPLFIEMSSTV